MRKRITFINASIALTALLLFGLPAQGQLQSPATREARQLENLKEEIRHQLVTMPYYSVFDWLQAEIGPDGTVTLNGQAVRPSIKTDAEKRVQQLEGVPRVVNNIEVLPPSTMDDQIRLRVYQAIFRYDSPLFRYATQSVPPIHIVVKGARVWLKGIVATAADSQLAAANARNVSGILDVHNELQVEGRTSVEVSKRN